MTETKRSKAWIERCLIDSPFCIGLCITKAAYNREMKRLKIKKALRPEWVSDGKGGTTHFLQCKNNKACIVCIIPRGKPIEIVGLLIHEAVHIWREIIYDMNEKQPSEEFEACSIQIISQRLIDKYDELKKKGGGK